MEARIKTIIMDVDGTLTDGKFYVNRFFTTVSFSVKDGYAIKFALDKGVSLIIISSNKSTLARKRLKTLGIKDKRMFFNVVKKESKLLEMFKKYSIQPSETLYIGDDLNDLLAMKLCGFSACPSDASEEIKLVSKKVSQYKGGYGAVREIIDFYSSILN
jgi:3-deoxy-D-manno-octulosonate 8-phosphate phosphatase (KDO 8-P phosphatase)